MAPQKFLDAFPSLNPEDIADGVLYALGVPPHVQVCSTFSKLILIFPCNGGVLKCNIHGQKDAKYTSFRITQNLFSNSTSVGFEDIIRSSLLFCGSFYDAACS
jgi:hypothetical protein